VKELAADVFLGTFIDKFVAAHKFGEAACEHD